jgi:hypothetical protein
LAGRRTPVIKPVLVRNNVLRTTECKNGRRLYHCYKNLVKQHTPAVKPASVGGLEHSKKHDNEKRRKVRKGKASIEHTVTVKKQKANNKIKSLLNEYYINE